MPYLFLLNMFEKNPPTFYQNPGFFWFNDCPVGCLVPWLRDWSASLVRFILFSETAASPIILLLNPLSYSSLINLLDKPLRPSLPRSISRDLKSFIIFNWKKNLKILLENLRKFNIIYFKSIHSQKLLLLQVNPILTKVLILIIVFIIHPCLIDFEAFLLTHLSTFSFRTTLILFNCYDLLC